MSDFDKILHDRLNEEAEFPGLENNWQKLSARLAAPPPSGGAGALGWFVPASLLALLLLNGGFGAMLWRLHHDNAELRARVAELQSRPQTTVAVAPDTLFSSRVVMQTDTVWRTVYVMPRLREAAADAPNMAKAGLVFDSKTAASPSASAVDFSGKTAAHPLEKAAPAAASPSASAVDFSEKTAAHPLEKTAPAAASPSASAVDFSEKTATEPTAAERQASAAEERNLPEKTTSQLDPSTAIAPREIAENQAVDAPPAAEEAVPKPADFDAAAGAQPIKKHRRSILRLTDFAIGANYTTGVPLVRDLAPWKGGGIMAEVNVAPQFRVKFMSDLTQLKYEGFNLDRKLNFPEAPEVPGSGGPGPGPKEHFEHITITQKRHQAGLRLEYLFPVERGLQPYLSAGYTWQRVATQDALFSHRDGHGGEITTHAAAPPQVFGTNWAAGFGVEWQGKHFGVGTSAEFLSNANKRTLNMPVIRAGVKYKF